MERLTKELWGGCTIEEFSHFVELDGVESKTVGNGWAHPVVVGKSIDLLATYEDTKLTPEEIKSLVHDGGISLAMRNRELIEQIQAQQQEIERLKGDLSDKDLEIAVVCERVEALVSDKDEQAGRIMRMEDELIRYKKAEAEGRLVMLPCKVGDTVYTVEKERNEHGTHDNIIVSHEVLWFEVTIGLVFAHITGKRRGYSWNCCMFGKTVFLTREEAEKDLLGGAEE